MSLTAAWTKLRYHPGQSNAWRSTKRFVNLPCGRGSGKSELARRRVVRMLCVRKPWIDPLYFYALPTYAQARRVAWEPILNLIPKEWILKVSESAMMVHTVFNSRLYIVGMDKPARLEGVQWDGGVIDESCDQKPGTFDRTIMPALSHRNGWCWRIGVPKRYGIGAGEFKSICDVGSAGTDPDVATFHWPSGDILTEKQIEAARRILDSRDFNEQYNASWETAGGLIFHAFGKENVRTDAIYDPRRKIMVGSDFNVDPMCWVIGHRDSNGIQIFDEIFLRNTSTQKTLDILYTRYQSHEAGWEFFGDAAARQRKTSAAQSDYLQIRNDKRFRNGQVYYTKSNPQVTDRFAAVNSLFANAQGVRRLFINPRCKHLIEDLSVRAYKEGTREPDDFGDVGHMSDALGYPVFRCFPIKLDIVAQPSIMVA